MCVPPQDGPWNCSEPESGCVCADACHSCSGATCICESSGFWQDPTDSEKCMNDISDIPWLAAAFSQRCSARCLCAAGIFAFGANIPKGFTHYVKQKPAGQLYVEYKVDCLRQAPAYLELIMGKHYMLIIFVVQDLQLTLHLHAFCVPYLKLRLGC